MGARVGDYLAPFFYFCTVAAAVNVIQTHEHKGDFKEW